MAIASRRTSRASGALAALLLCAGAAGADVLVRAGTIHPMDGREPLTGGAAVLVRDGRIVAVGKDVAAPPGAEVVDYGPSAVVVPGLVSVSSALFSGRPADRTAAPGVLAVDGFDFFGRYDWALSAGVTTTYVAPARGRLIAGQGAVVKLGGDDPARRVLAAPACLQGSVSDDARNTPGYWEPPIPPTVDTGIGWAKPQLPRSLMGAMVALGELMDGLGKDSDEYGPAPRLLAPLVQAKTPWRMRAQTPEEVRALLGFARERSVPLVLDGMGGAGGTAASVAAAGVPVIYEVPFQPNASGVDRGTSPDDPWPDYALPAELAAAGVRFAIASPSSARDLVFAARLAMRGGLAPETALRAITLAPAEILGAAGRVGSLAPGKDADLAVFSGEPMAGGEPLATWLDGRAVWQAEASAKSAVVIQADELHVGDGQVLRPGSLLVKGGRIVEVSRGVARPQGARVVHGAVVMPGMIDALGHLGLEGTRGSPRADFSLGRIVGPGDDADRRVALAGVTTVVLAPRGEGRGGTPMLAYKPASGGDGQVIADPVSLRLVWTEQNRLKSGDDVRGLLEKAQKYAEKWQEYETKLAEWEASRTAEPAPAPAPAEPKKDEKADDKDKKKEDEKASEDGDDKKDDKKKGKKKKDEEEPPEADPVTGIWEGSLVRPPRTEPASLRIQLVMKDAEVEGSIRCDALSSDLIRVEGRFADGELAVAGLGDEGWVRLTGKPKKGSFEGVLAVGGAELAVAVERKRPDVPRASRPAGTTATSKEEDDRSKPRPPKLDDKLEPLRRAMQGEGTIVVTVDRDDEILDCVETFERAGIRPVLHGADGVRWVADRVAGRIAGVILRHEIVSYERDEGLVFRNRYAELQGAGIPIAFHSLAEEGAADLAAMAAYAVANGLSAEGAVRALTADAADMYGIDDHVGRLRPGLDADVLLLDGPPLDPATRVLRAWVGGEEVLRR